MSASLYAIIELILNLVEIGIKRQDILARIAVETEAGASAEQISKKLKEWRDQAIQEAQQEIDSEAGSPSQ